MTNKRLIITEIIGLLICLVLSFVFHFAFEWFHRTTGIAWLFATNESVWEHSKIIFYPYLIFSIIEYFIIKPDIKVFLTAKSIPLMLAIPLMLIIFYTYSGIIGKSIVAVDITIAILIIYLMFFISYKIIMKGYISNWYIVFTIIAILIVLLLIIFTYFPPHIKLFYDILDKKYGI